MPDQNLIRLPSHFPREVAHSEERAACLCFLISSQDDDELRMKKPAHPKTRGRMTFARLPSGPDKQVHNMPV
jgi:hypothetical protein